MHSFHVSDKELELFLLPFFLPINTAHLRRKKVLLGSVTCNSEESYITIKKPVHVFTIDLEIMQNLIVQVDF